LMNIFNFY